MTKKKLGLLDGPAPRLRAIPAAAPFLDVLAGSMVEALHGDDPFALSDALVLLPNRRAARGLIDAFAKRLNNAALLPNIRPLGDLDEDPDVWGAEPIALNVAPAIAPTRQRLELAALIRARDRAAGGHEDPARAIALADELRRLLDSAAAVDEVHWDLLPNLPEQVELAAHWQASAQFLDIVATYWPARLQADGLSDPGARRSEVLHALAREWERAPPKGPVIIAGSTGSIAATRALMATAAALPRGVVVLPGLDSDLDEDAWSAIGDQHPQFALKQTLAALGVARSDVPLLGVETETGRARRILMREALAPAEKTADWLKRLDHAGGADFVARGAEGVSVLEAASEDEEAAAIALLLRQALETEGRSAALATPDASLARRVEAKLARWGVTPVVSHGRPLRETQTGGLIALLCDLARDSAEPIALGALIKHPLAHFGFGAERLKQMRTRLEHQALRGARKHDDLASLRALPALEKEDEARALVSKVEEALTPLRALGAQAEVTLADFADAITAAAENVSSKDDLWRGVDGEVVSLLLNEAIEHGAELGALNVWAAPRALMKLMDGRETPPPPGGDPRIAIWGPLEARLQRRDLMILGSLNEGVWPAPPPDDPFLSRAMRFRLGLPSLDARIGLAAHDFAQLVSAPEVVLSRALKREGAPTVASRWLWRLETLAKGAKRELSRAAAPIAWARALDAPSIVRVAKAPRPKPPADARLKRISVTQVETLIRDPYAVYARRILGLEALKPIGERAGPAERGTAIHDALDQFNDGVDPAELLILLDRALQQGGFTPERRLAEQARLAASARAYVQWLADTRAEDTQVFREEGGELTLKAGPTLSAKADRIEIDSSGAGVVLDFKTGAPPSDKEVASGIAPQMTLQAAMLSRGAFKAIPRASVAELFYWRFGGADPKPAAIDFKDKTAFQAAEEALAQLESLLSRYNDATQPFLSSPRVKFAAKYHDYDHLARRKEWADAEGGE